MRRLTGPGHCLSAALLVVVNVLSMRAADPTPTNRLARESSPYLLMHAHNPVNWYAWGPDAFAKAKKENKLVFLSVGYSACYWCHVMERESFANADVAKLMNDWFVCIKVDREERPDVDSVYMAALNATGQRGGWPLSMFLTADGKPIVGFTYRPAEDRAVDGEKVPGFKTILTILHTAQKEKAESLKNQAEKVAAVTIDYLSRAQRGTALVPLDQELVTAAVQSLTEEFDPLHGGFGSPSRSFKGTKFPMPTYLELLHHEAVREKSPKLAEVVTRSLDHMARGGIYDQLGGGFHRYSTERTWTVPHFEKMLYDNAQLAEVYARVYQQTKQPEYRRVVVETLAFVQRELTSPEGGFYSALDAETKGEEGRFYVWTAEELKDALPDPADRELLRVVYGTDELNFESKYHILHLKQTPTEFEAKLAPIRKKLFEVREKRPRPFLDRKILTAWNGQMIAGYAAAGQSLHEPHYLEVAATAADFVLTHLRTKDGRLLRTYGSRPGEAAEAKLNAYLDDYAFLVHGLLNLHDATGSAHWLEEATALTDRMIELFADPAGDGFFYTSSDHEKLFVRTKDQYDGVQPSGNSMAARNLVRMWLKTKNVVYKKQAEKTMKTFAGTLKSNPSSLTALALGLALLLDAGEPPVGAAEPIASVAGQKGERSDDYVKVTATATPLQPGADGVQQLVVTIVVDADWHAGANPAGESGVPTTVLVSAAQKPTLKLDYPAGKLRKDPDGDYFVYEGSITLKGTVQRGAGDVSPLDVSVKLGVCSDKLKKCLPPAKIKVVVK